MNKSNFSERMKIERKRKCLTQAELAEKLEISEMTIRRWESGERSPRLIEIEKMCSVFMVSLCDLIGITQEGQSPSKTNEISPSLSEDIINKKENKIDLGLAYWGNVVDNARCVANAGTEQEKSAVLMMLNMAVNSFQRVPPQNIGVQQNNISGDNNYNGTTGK